MTDNSIGKTVSFILSKKILFLPTLALIALRTNSVSFFMLLLANLGAETWVISSVAAANVLGWIGVQHLFRDKKTSLKRSLFIGGWSVIVAMLAILAMLFSNNTTVIVIGTTIYTMAGITMILIGAHQDHAIKYSKACK